MRIPKEVSVIGIDMDDVTADLSSKALYYYNLNKIDKITKEDLLSWHGNWDLLKEHYLTPSIYSELPVIDGSVEVLKELNEKYHVVFITASPSVDCTVSKLNWVDEHFPFIGSDNVIATKYKYLINADVLFDDSPEFLPKFNGYRVLMEQIYNNHLTDIDYDFKVNNWEGFKQVIEDLENRNQLLKKKLV
jgi:5'(3')-deoxyribonucleotidase